MIDRLNQYVLENNGYGQLFSVCVHAGHIDEKYTEGSDPFAQVFPLSHLTQYILDPCDTVEVIWSWELWAWRVGPYLTNGR